MKSLDHVNSADSVGRPRRDILRLIFLCMRARYFRPGDPGIYSYATSITAFTPPRQFSNFDDTRTTGVFPFTKKWTEMMPRMLGSGKRYDLTLLELEETRFSRFLSGGCCLSRNLHFASRDATALESEWKKSGRSARWRKIRRRGR